MEPQESIQAYLSNPKCDSPDDGVTLLVPGVPEADTDQEAYDALVRWTRWAFPVQPEAGEAL